MTTSIAELEKKGWKNVYHNNTSIYLNIISSNCINNVYKYIYYEEIDGILYKKLDTLSDFKNYMHNETTITTETLDTVISNPIKQLRKNITNPIFKDYDLVSFGAHEKLKYDLRNIHLKIDNDLHFTVAKDSDFDSSVRTEFHLVNDFMRLVNIKDLGEHQLGWIKLDEPINSTSIITIKEALQEQGYGLYWSKSEIYFFYQCPEHSLTAYPGNPQYFGMCRCDDGYTTYKGNGEELCRPSCDLLNNNNISTRISIGDRKCENKSVHGGDCTVYYNSSGDICQNSKAPSTADGQYNCEKAINCPPPTPAPPAPAPPPTPAPAPATPAPPAPAPPASPAPAPPAPAPPAPPAPAPPAPAPPAPPAPSSSICSDPKKPCLHDNLGDNTCFAKQNLFGNMVCPAGTTEQKNDSSTVITPYTSFKIPSTFKRTW